MTSSVVAIWRYPVKSMMGEELNSAVLGEGGVAGDRAYALVDSSDGKVATAKNPRKWPNLFSFRAALVGSPNGEGMQTVLITLPDGSVVRSDEAGIDARLSAALGRSLTIESSANARKVPAGAPATGGLASTAEEYWPDIEGLDHRDTVTEFGLPAGTFFDSAILHVLTTATLDRLREVYPAGRFEARRFRPNLVIDPEAGSAFAENAWVGRTLAVGDTVHLAITGSCARCVMTTLAQGDLPRDVGILRAAAQNNQANVGVYATVAEGGIVRRGDRVTLQ
jgi:uncharacterized protein